MPSPGYISASMAGRLMSAGRGKTEFGQTFYSLCKEVAAARLGWDVTRELAGMPCIEWGIENEKYAIEAYEESRLVSVDYANFVKHPDPEYADFAGCTPDGLVGANGMIEVKCPNCNNHLDNILSNSQLASYVPQMQFSMWVLRVDWCDWISYDPRAPEGLQLHVVRVGRDESYIDVMVSRVEEARVQVDRYAARLDEIRGLTA